MKINCLLIDDEPSSQNVLKNYFEKLDFLHLVGVCNNAVEAISFLSKNTTVDLLFLDINMPKISGLSFYKSLNNSPSVIFTTAYSEYAVEAFDVNAIDYLLKPFSFERFLSAVNKFIKTTETTKDGEPHSETMLIKADKKLHKIEISKIFFIEAYGDYVKVHFEDSFLLTNNTFKNILSELSSLFIQIHKSYAINLNKASSIEGNQVTINHQKLPIGLKYKEQFIMKFRNN